MKYFLFFFTLLICACNFRSSKNQNNLDELLDIENTFSTKSKEIGFNKAAELYYDQNEVIRIGSKEKPQLAPDVFVDLELGKKTDSIYEMSWKVKGGHLSKTNDEGYTYGTFIYKDKETLEEYKGTYVNFWRKNTKGEWKIVFNTTHDYNPESFENQNIEEKILTEE